MKSALLPILAVAYCNPSFTNAGRTRKINEAQRNAQDHQQNQASSSHQGSPYLERDAFVNRLHHHALAYPYGADPNVQNHHFRYDDSARMFDNFQLEDDTEASSDLGYADEGISIEGLQDQNNLEMDSEDEARYYDEGLEPVEDYTPLWEPDYFSIYDVTAREHYTSDQIDYTNQIIDVVNDDPSALQEQEQAFEDALYNGNLDTDQMRELQRGLKNQRMRTDALQHISVLQPDNIGSYNGCLFVPQKNIVIYNSNLKPRDVERRFYNQRRPHPHMPSLYSFPRSGKVLFKSRRLRQRVRRNDDNRE